MKKKIYFTICILGLLLLSGCSDKKIIDNEKVDCFSSEKNLTVFTLTGSLNNFTLYDNDMICFYNTDGNIKKVG